MRKLRPILSVILVLCMLLSTLTVASAAQTGTPGGDDTTPPVIDLSTLTISDTEIDRDGNESVKIRFKVTDANELQTISVSYTCNGGINGAGASYYRTNSFQASLYDGEYFEADVHFFGEGGKTFYGNYEIFSIDATDVYGNTVCMTRYVYGAELDKGSFRVTGSGFVANDTTGPVIDYRNITVDTQVAAGEKAKFSVPVTDASEIYSVQVEYGSDNTDVEGSRSIAQLTYNAETGRYEGEINFNYLGYNSLIAIWATDANNYSNRFVNTAYPFSADFVEDSNNTQVKDDASDATVYHGNAAQEDSKAPVVDLSSLTLEKRVLERDEVAHATLTVSDDSEMKVISMRFMHERYGLPYYVTPISSENGVYTFNLPSGMFGAWRLARIDAVDAYGNTTTYADTNVYYYNDIRHTDLSAYNYYVGVIDETTGVSVSDASMGNNTTLSVTENPLSGTVYDQLLEEDCTAHAFYDVSVSGDRGDKTSLLIPAPEGLDEGDYVRVVHLKADGTTENLDTVVENGLIAVTVSEFSPFLLETGFTRSVNVSIDAGGGVPFKISAPPPLGNNEPSSYIGEATLSVEAGQTLADLGVNVWHDDEHLPYFEGWTISTWDPANEWWVLKKDSDGKLVILDTATMLATPITEDVLFEPSWKMFSVYFEGNGGTFDLDMSDIHIGDDMAKSAWRIAYYHNFADFRISDIRNGTNYFYGWDVYERVEDPNNPENYELTFLEGPISTEKALSRPVTHNVVFQANWTGWDEDYYSSVHFNAMGGTFRVTAYDYIDGVPVVLGTIPMDGSRIEGCKENGQSVKEQFDASYYPNTDPVHEGYTFEGWLAVYEDQYWHEMSDKLYTTEQVVNLPVPKENVQYLAKWKEISMEEYRFGNPYFPYDGSYSELYYLANGGTFNVTVNFNNGSPHSYSSPYIIYTTDSSLTFEESQQQGVVQRTFELADKTNFEGWTTYQADQIFKVAIKKGDKLNVLGENFTVFKAGDEKYEDENGDFIQSEVYVLLKNAKVYSTTMTPQDALNLKGDQFYATVAQWHKECSTLANVKAATCTAEGYTGDKVCANCGEVLEKGTAIAKTAHTASPNLANVKAATCSAEGYTGDKVCASCGEILEKGKVIEKTAHTASPNLANVKAATCTAEGYTGDKVCAGCGEILEKGKVIEKTAHTASPNLANVKSATHTAEGYTGDKVCADCGAVIEAGKVIDKIKETVATPVVKEEAKASIDTQIKDVVAVISGEKAEETKIVLSEGTKKAIEEAVTEGHAVGADIVIEQITQENLSGEALETFKTESAAIETKAAQEIGETAVVAEFIDISVIVTNRTTGEELGNITELEEPVVIEIHVPEALQADNREYYIVHYHDGKADLIKGEYKDGVLSISADKFSTYALVYADVPAPNPNVPNTGDQSQLMLFTTMLLLAAAGLYLTSRKLRRA